MPGRVFEFSAVILFSAGLIIGIGIVGYFYLSLRKEVRRLEEARQLIDQEKQIVLDFSQNLVEAMEEGEDRRELFQRVAHAAIISTGALSACVFERDERDILRGVFVEGLFPPQRPFPEHSGAPPASRTQFMEKILRSESFKLGEGLVGSAAASGKGVLIPDAARDARVVRHKDPSLQTRSLILVPIRFREKNIGVLAVANPVHGGAFKETDFSLLKSLAARVGSAIHNADGMQLRIEKNKLDMDLALASNIQGLLLPKRFPHQPSLDLDARFLPARKVGGDLYDVFALSEREIGIAIADVSGKGIPASLLMTICQNNFRHFARGKTSPGDVLRALNKGMKAVMRKDMFITVIYAIIDAAKGELRLARAGHELPILCRRDPETGKGTIRKIESEGMALGMVGPEKFDEIMTEKKIAFAKGDSLVLYTDGVTETVNYDGSEFGSDRLESLLMMHPEDSAKELNQRILDEIGEFSGENGQSDDITLLTVKHK